MTEPFLTTEQVAEWLGVHPVTIQRWVRFEGLPVYRPARQYRYDRAQAQVWLDQRHQGQERAQ